MNTAVHPRSAADASTSSALAEALVGLLADPKDFLRRLHRSLATVDPVIGLLLVDGDAGEHWLLREPDCDAELRGAFEREGYLEAREAHAVDPSTPATEDPPRSAFQVDEVGQGARRLVVAREAIVARGRTIDAGSLRLALQLFDQVHRLENSHQELRGVRRRVVQVRAGLRAGFRLDRAFEDLEGAATWLQDLAQAFGADATMGIFEGHASKPLFLCAGALTSSLQDEFAGWARHRFEKEHSLELRPRVGLRRLADEGTQLRELEWVDAPPRCPKPENWPSRLAAPFLTREGEFGLVAMAARRPDAFAPEAAGMLRTAVASMAHGISRVLQRERDRRRLLQRVLEKLPQGLVWIGRDGTLQVVNEEARRLFDLKGGTLAHLEDFERASGLTLSLWIEEIQASSEDRMLQEVLDRPDELGPVHVDALRIPGATEDSSDVLLTFRDVSEEQRRDRARSEFVNTVGHELKTPLTSMLTAMEILSSEEAGALGEDQRRFVDLTRRNLGRLGERIDQLLMIARQEGGQLVVRREDRDLVDLLRPFVENTEVQTLREERRFDCDLPTEAPAFVDPTRFVEVVENLVSNAFKFTPRDRRVTLSLRTNMPCPVHRNREIAQPFGVELEGVEIEVSDEGTGMSPETAHHAFDPFYQEGDPLATRPEGAGLGLSIVRSLVEAHAGEIEVSSRVGEGTSMRVWIPANRGAARLIGGLRQLRRRLERARRRHDEVELSLLEMSGDLDADLGGLDVVDGGDGLLVRLGDGWVVAAHDGGPLREAPGRVASTRYPAEGSRLGTLLAGLIEQVAPPRVLQSPGAPEERHRDD